MDFGLLASLYTDLTADNFCFFYRGEFSDQITSQLFTISESRLNESKGAVRKKVNFLMVECIQNIERHGIVHPEHDNSLGYFSLRSRENAFFLTSANIISSDIIHSLRSTLDHINELSEEELKKLYMEVLGQGKLSEKGGAGLGIIEMARKSGNKLEYEFLPLDQGVSYFYLQLSIASQKGEALEPLPIRESLRYHGVLLEHNVQFLYYGSFNNETIKPIAYTLEQNVTVSNNLEMSRLLFHILIELMQNVAKYSIGEEEHRHGMFAITAEGDSFSILSSNLVNHENRIRLTEIIEMVNTKSKEELNTLYREELLRDDDMSSAGIGFIDIMRNTSSPIEYSFSPVGESILYQVKVTV